MSDRLTDDDLLEMAEIVIAFTPSRGVSLLNRALAELRERRAADLNQEQVELLRWAVEMAASAPLNSIGQARQQRAVAVVNALLSGGKR